MKGRDGAPPLGQVQRSRLAAEGARVSEGWRMTDHGGNALVYRAKVLRTTSFSEGSYTADFGHPRSQHLSERHPCRIGISAPFFSSSSASGNRSSQACCSWGRLPQACPHDILKQGISVEQAGLEAHSLWRGAIAREIHPRPAPGPSAYPPCASRHRLVHMPFGPQNSMSYVL